MSKSHSHPLDKCLDLVLPFLWAAERYKVAQVCRKYRQEISTWRWESEALKESLIYGYRLGVTLRPRSQFVGPSEQNLLLELRKGIRSWHQLRARRSRVPNGPVLLPGGDSVTISQAQKPTKSVFGTRASDTSPRCWRGKPALQSEATAWPLIGEILHSFQEKMSTSILDSVPLVLRVITTNPRCAKDILESPVDLELWEKGFMPLQERVAEAFEQAALTEDQTTDRPWVGLSSLGSAHDEDRLIEFANSELKQAVYASGFKPLVDLEDEHGTTHGKYIVVKHCNGNTIHLEGQNAYTLRYCKAVWCQPVDCAGRFQ
eukprot:Protomagalhaensia_wolfi_Nauph_80__202@NODE_110_length_3640_cov_84_028048_g83_i0_p3_GENE_NODE_110_length_3640_cov_84_028048_g83_i0NODE_110_length_3640_cov_84_028048_g83_i0_p3_ORF_typecomplete_len317_score28_87_NODE_110_length_3640_cov_84_028048_g83_i013602310